MQGINSTFKKLKKLIKYGLLFEAITSRLYKIGININPFYVFKEHLVENLVKKYSTGFSDYSVTNFSLRDMEYINESRYGKGNIKFYINRFDKGNRCIGVKLGNEIAAYTWVNLEECHFKGDVFQLKKNEAYLFDTYVLSAFRGKGIAPFLRTQCYKSLGEMGITEFYSVAYYFNTPAIVFKKKLGAEYMKFGLLVELFNKYSWAYIFKRY